MAQCPGMTEAEGTYLETGKDGCNFPGNGEGALPARAPGSGFGRNPVGASSEGRNEGPPDASAPGTRHPPHQSGRCRNFGDGGPTGPFGERQGILRDGDQARKGDLDGRTEWRRSGGRRGRDRAFAPEDLTRSGPGSGFKTPFGAVGRQNRSGVKGRPSWSKGPHGPLGRRSPHFLCFSATPLASRRGALPKNWTEGGASAQSKVNAVALILLTRRSRCRTCRRRSGR